MRSVPSLSAEQNAARSAAQQRSMAALLARVQFVVALCTSWLCLAGWLFPKGGPAMLLGTFGLIAGLVLVLVLFVVSFRRAVAVPVGASVGAAQASGAPHADGRAAVDSPDDDRFWKAGILYINRDDPAVLVPRRFGAGWTMNLGHPGGVAIGVALLVLVVAALLLPIVLHAAG
jgi:uncharacterized membrane protein